MVHRVSATIDSLAGVVLAAGAGTRLAPLTRVRPKALCPVGGTPLVDLAVRRVSEVASDVWVNVHHGADQLLPHLASLRTPTGLAVRTSHEEAEALGTAGALGLLRPHLADRPVVVVNADAWSTASLAPLLDGWDGGRIRVLVPGGGPFGPTSQVAACLLPWDVVSALAPVPSGLYEHAWAPAAAAGGLEVVEHVGAFVDCGTPTDYLAANLLASGGTSVVGAGTRVLGAIDRCVLWEGVTVGAGEQLRDAIRATDAMTVYVR